jgi:replicative DNA helicase
MSEPEIAYSKIHETEKEAERRLLGSILIETNGFCDAEIEFEKARGGDSGREFFKLEKHAIIYRIMKRVHERGGQTDLLEVKWLLELRGILDAVGGVWYLAGLVDMKTKADAKWYAKVVIAQSNLRRLER